MDKAANQHQEVDNYGTENNAQNVPVITKRNREKETNNK